ncbi:hypothetical protein [Streptomyces coeruleorubidus]
MPCPGSGIDARSYSLIASGYPPVTTTVTVDGRGLDDVHLELAHRGS